MGAPVRKAAVIATEWPDYLRLSAEQFVAGMAVPLVIDPNRFLAKILADETCLVKTIVYDGNIAGNMVCWEQLGEREVGYWLGKEYWGQGIASAALSQFLVQATKRPLFAHVAKHNLASIRVLQKCGFTPAELQGIYRGNAAKFIPKFA